MSETRELILNALSNGRWLEAGEVRQATGIQGRRLNNDLQCLCGQGLILKKPHESKPSKNKYRKPAAEKLPEAGRVRLFDSYLRGTR